MVLFSERPCGERGRRPLEGSLSAQCEGVGLALSEQSWRLEIWDSGEMSGLESYAWGPSQYGWI